MKQKDYFINCPHDLYYIAYANKISKKNTELPQAFFPIIGIIAEDTNYNIRSYSFMARCLDIEGYYRSKKSRCRIQFSCGPDNNIVVQSIQLIHQRQGYMTRLYEILKHIKRTYRTGEIIIQSVLTDECRNWCEKNDLVPDGQGNFVQKK